MTYAEQHAREMAGEIGLLAVRCAVKPGASRAALADDLECLFGSAVSALEAMSQDAVDESAPPEISGRWYAMLYTMRQARTVWLQLYEREARQRATPVGRSPSDDPALPRVRACALSPGCVAVVQFGQGAQAGEPAHTILLDPDRARSLADALVRAAEVAERAD